MSVLAVTLAVAHLLATPAAPAETPAVTSAVRRALVVGIDEYGEGGLAASPPGNVGKRVFRNLEGAVNDADEMPNLMVGRFGFLEHGFSVVHLATHFAFRAGSAGDSFLLLGDGRRLSLAALGDRNLRFDGIDLLTLSACETALDSRDGYGQEIEGLGTFAQGQGAAAVLATLWSVADASTGSVPSCVGSTLCTNRRRRAVPKRCNALSLRSSVVMRRRLRRTNGRLAEGWRPCRPRDQLNPHFDPISGGPTPIPFTGRPPF